MYYLVVAALMLVSPVASIVIDASLHFHGLPNLDLVGKWFVFWSVGVRLLLAGVRQIVQPGFTAKTLLGIDSTDSFVLVRELGFANTAIGVTAMCSVFFTGWIPACALAGAIFYGFAGINHLAHKNRNRLQTTAMISDLFAAAVLLVYCAAAAAHYVRP
jgi:hypothetical protein